MRSGVLLIMRALLLILAFSVGSGGMANAAAGHTLHCVPLSVEQSLNIDAHPSLESDHIHSSYESSDQRFKDSLTETSADCLTHPCSGTLLGSSVCFYVGGAALIVIIAEPKELITLIRSESLHRPPSI